MNQLLSEIPSFWQGVLASVVAALFVGIAVQLWRISFSTVSKTSETRRIYRQRVISGLSSKTAAERALATRHVLTKSAISFVSASVFSSVIGLLWWVPMVSEILTLFVPVSIVVTLYLYLNSLSWLRIYLRHAAAY